MSLIVQQGAMKIWLGRFWYFVVPAFFVIWLPGFILTIIMAEFRYATLQTRGAPGIHNDLARLMEERWQVLRGGPSDARLNRFLKAAAPVRSKGSLWSRFPSVGTTLLRRLRSRREGRLGLRLGDAHTLDLLQLQAVLATRLEPGRHGVKSFQELRAVASMIMTRFGEIIPKTNGLKRLRSQPTLRWLEFSDPLWSKPSATVRREDDRRERHMNSILTR
eukprot:jgi/Botrbrau1/22148/Bobra.0206s0072.1